jgi:hypothetical protein
VAPVTTATPVVTTPAPTVDTTPTVADTLASETTAPVSIVLVPVTPPQVLSAPAATMVTSEPAPTGPTLASVVISVEHAVLPLTAHASGLVYATNAFSLGLPTDPATDGSTFTHTEDSVLRTRPAYRFYLMRMPATVDVRASVRSAQERSGLA